MSDVLVMREFRPFAWIDTGPRTAPSFLQATKRSIFRHPLTRPTAKKTLRGSSWRDHGLSTLDVAYQRAFWRRDDRAPIQ